MASLPLCLASISPGERGSSNSSPRWLGVHLWLPNKHDGQDYLQQCWPCFQAVSQTYDLSLNGGGGKHEQRGAPAWKFGALGLGPAYPVTDQWHSFIHHSFPQEAFMEHLLCVRFWIRHWRQWVEHSLLDFVFPESKGPVLSSVQFSSVQFSCSVVSDSLRSHELQHARPPCPSPTPGVHPNPCPLSRWCHPIISSSVIPFSQFQSFPASGSFPMSQFFASGGQSIQLQHQSFQWTPGTDL